MHIHIMYVHVTQMCVLIMCMHAINMPTCRYVKVLENTGACRVVHVM